MFKFVILSVMLPLLVTSLLFSKYIFYNSVFHNQHNKYPIVNFSISYAGFALLFITHEYFLISISYNSLGFIVYDYVLGLTAFFWIEKRYGGLIILATPLVVSIYMILVHHMVVWHIACGIVLAGVILLLALFVGSNKRKHRFIGYIFLLIIISVATPLFNSFIYSEPFNSFYDFFCIVAGALFICMNLWLFNLQRSKNIHELALLKKHEQFDTLTGLHSFFSFNQLMLEEHVDSTRCWVFLMLDIDHFKWINDEYGHLEGNKVLTFFANRLKEHFKNHVSANYKIYRFGGEEFCVVIEDFLPDESYMVINDFRDRLENEHFVASDGTPIQVSFSGGISSTQDFNGSVSDAVRRADEAFYSAKKKGRAQIARYRPEDAYGHLSDEV